ncbi:WD40 repeat-like protein [Neoconidiobolus thromboides FSU 785]|nr:WD40 repeat-like protein [Neoconidiobolus thromboides FSU 785]
MKASTLQFLWHCKDPIYSLDFHPNIKDYFATCGSDSTVRLWRLVPRGEEVFPIVNEGLKKNKKDPLVIDFSKNEISKSKQVKELPLTIEYMATLSGHNAPVNVVKFSPDGSMLASAGDDGSILLWKKKEDLVREDGSIIQQDSGINNNISGQGIDEYALERWKTVAVLRGSLSDIYDLTWSPNGQFIVTGSVDNTARVWDISTSRCLAIINEHKHYIQGVAWDPLNEYIITQSSDRTVKIHKFQYKSSSGTMIIKCVNSNWKLDFKEDKLKEINNYNEELNKTNNAFYYLYQSENLKSFFRRPDFTPDGSLALTPAGIFKESADDQAHFVVYIYTRGAIANSPILKLSGFEQPPIAIKASPRVYKKMEFNNGQREILNLDYRCVFAVATQNSIFIYDTQHLNPIAYVSNLHFATLTDLSWSPDGNTLLISSTDGFVSMIRFEDHELGIPLNIAFSNNIVSFETKPKVSNTKSETVKVDTPVKIETPKIKKEKKKNDKNKLISPTKTMDHTPTKGIKVVMEGENKMLNNTVRNSKVENIKHYQFVNILSPKKKPKQNKNDTPTILQNTTTNEVKVQDENIASDILSPSKLKKRIVPTLISSPSTKPSKN